MPANLPPSADFMFLIRCDARVVAVPTRAEQYFPDDSVTSLMELHRVGRMLARLIAAQTGVFTTKEELQAELLPRPRREGVVPRDILDVFPDRWRRGNNAIHGYENDHAETRAGLRLARQLAMHSTFSGHVRQRGGIWCWA